ncbi:pseudouridine synthase [Staphylotrichum tortipilum]|uniref:Pseudouridine synthase n=1 Tax=Staphylotrichum tortipilum TaxID=2831512 RepID=A0AAN6MHT9_9PEZI|nr:pseudouridine synthase [Staphylotrichum longicolle]
MADKADYQDWSKDRLVERVRELEAQLKTQTPDSGAKQKNQKQQPNPSAPPAAPGSPSKKQPKQKPPKQHPPTVAHSPAKQEKKPKNSAFDPSKYSTRLVALKLAYLGRRYGGFEYQTRAQAPSIEEHLWRALVRSCLITPADPARVDFTPFEYSKCGRTDKGVSAFGQVIGIRLRSNRPLEKDGAAVGDVEGKGEVGGEGDVEMAEATAEEEVVDAGKAKPVWDPIADEINYPRVLNKLLPPEIRVLGWAPTLPANFSARFSCRERQYRYFFTQPAFSPVPASMGGEGIARPGEGWLDIDAMRRAAKLFEGVHDFRNFCKIDGTKQISNFRRRVFEADVVEVEEAGAGLPYLSQPDFLPPVRSGADGGVPAYPKVYYFHVRGSAFLWHQIRHMVAVLFMVGQGLEEPSVITELLDIAKFPRRPNYVMADEVPLVLWDCIFPKTEGGKALSTEDAADMQDPGVVVSTDFVDAIDWVWVGEDKPEHLHGHNGVADQLWECWRERRVDELLAGQLLDAVSRRADLSRRLAPGPPEKPSNCQRTYDGGNLARPAGVYMPLLKRQLLATAAEVNEKWARRKGFEGGAEELARTTNWREVMKAKRAAAAAAGAEQP